MGRAPRPAVDPLVDLHEHRKSRTKGSGADVGVRPTFGCGYAALWGRPSFLVVCQASPNRSVVSQNLGGRCAGLISQIAVWGEPAKELMALASDDGSRDNEQL